jgi:hypothetical protein
MELFEKNENPHSDCGPDYRIEALADLPELVAQHHK